MIEKKKNKVINYCTNCRRGGGGAWLDLVKGWKVAVRRNPSRERRISLVCYFVTEINRHRRSVRSGSVWNHQCMRIIILLVVVPLTLMVIVLIFTDWHITLHNNKQYGNIAQTLSITHPQNQTKLLFTKHISSVLVRPNVKMNHGRRLGETIYIWVNICSAFAINTFSKRIGLKSNF